MATRAILASLAGAVCALSTTAPASAGTRVCGERSQILKELERSHEETPKALGLSADGGLIEVLVSPDGESFTMLVTYPNKPTCVLAVGQAWQTLHLTGGLPA